MSSLSFTRPHSKRFHLNRLTFILPACLSSLLLPPKMCILEHRPFSYWDIASRAHPSAFLTSALVRPRIFPFPMGFSAEKKNLYWESGQQPEVGHFKPGSEYEKKKREEKIKEITTRLRAEDRATQERAEIYTEQKRMAEQRIKHVKILCSIVLLAFGRFDPFPHCVPYTPC